jgi:hypothetical protein
MDLVFVGGPTQVQFKIYDKKPNAYRITNKIQSNSFTLFALIAAHDSYNFVSGAHWYFVKRKDFAKYCRPDSFKIDNLEEVCVKEFIL